jgi:hypothetical protein
LEFAYAAAAGTEAIHPFPHSRQPPVSGAPAGLENFGGDSFSIVADVHAEMAALVTDFGLDPAGLGVAKRVAQQFAEIR